MKSSWFPITLVAVLLALLGLLAFLQYRWLGQISDGERERLTRTVRSDTDRFAEDFNSEIQKAYFNFQLNGDVWREKNWTEFNARYEFYKANTAYPQLVKDFYFAESGENRSLLKYQKDRREFSASEWSEELKALSATLANDEPPTIQDEVPALLVPAFEETKTIDRILIRTPVTENIQGIPKILKKKTGFLIIVLDRGVIENEILPDLAKKYFSRNESADYKLAVTDRNNRPIFQTGEIAAADASVKIFNIAPERLTFFARREVPPSIGAATEKNLVISQVESRTELKTSPDKHEEKIDVQVFSRGQTKADGKPRVRILEGQNLDAAGVWTLNVQHSAGSLEQFIANTRNRNLIVSFGILTLLAASMILIFISSQRARAFAQRQVDFVSSVSHEFRTPLAVIYSAGENLSDGVIRDENKITSYGNLIKREGKKLSSMVEQILEFAGARSGNRKYDFHPVEVGRIIDEAIAECRPLIEEKDFTIEQQIGAGLPPVSGDRRALTQAVQNLIANSIKYSDGEKHVKISARFENGKVNISVEDRGIGIDKSELSKIFEPFYRSKKVVDAQIRGNGLGLSLVKQIVEAHGGRVEAESSSEKGSRFKISLSPIKIGEKEIVKQPFTAEGRPL